MTLQTITAALSQGYSISKIIKSVMNMNTPLAKSIKEALRQGYNEDQIGEYLSKGKTSSYSQKNKMLPGMTDQEKSRGILYRQPKSEKNIGNILKTAAMTAPVAAAGAFAAPAISAAAGSIAPQAMNALRRAAPQLLGPGAVAGGVSPQQSPQQMPAQAASPIQSPSSILSPSQQSPQVSPQSIAQESPNIQPEVFSKAKQYLEEKGVREVVDQLLAAGNDPETVVAGLGIKNKSGKVQSKIDPELLSAVEIYAQGNNNEERASRNGDTSEQKNFDAVGGMPESKEQINLPPEQPEGVVPGMEAEPSAKEPLEEPELKKGLYATSPKGVGKLLEIRGDKAIVEINGTKHQFDKDELDPNFFTLDDMTDAYEKYISMVPEEHKSSFISWAGYDEDTNELGYTPHGGKYQVLKNITPEEAEIIKNGKGVARTTGGNREGLYFIGGDTGAGLISQIIHDRRRKKESSEKQQLEFDFNLPKPEKQDKGMKPIFATNAFAQQLSQDRDKKKRLEERAKKKKERDDEREREKREKAAKRKK